MPEMSNRRRVRWSAPEDAVSWAPAPLSFEFPTSDASLARGASAEDAVARAVRAYGVPTMPDAASAEDEAMTLLEIAAEAEHALMAQYLYGAYSTKDLETGRVLRWIAIEEMGHLLTVQNLRLVLGGNCYLRRQDESPQPEFDPYPLKLEPLSADSLAKYVAAEAPEPESLPEDEKAELAEISRRAGQAAGVPLVHPVALVYMRLFYLFQERDEPTEPWPDAAGTGSWGKRWHVAEENLEPASLTFQGIADEWSADPEISFLALAAATREQCRNVIHQVAAQGEGSPGVADSHFARFRAIYRQADSNALPIYQVPEIGTDVVDAEPAATLSRLFDARYEILLINLQQLFHYARDGGGTDLRAEIVGWCRSEMRMVLGPLHRDMLRRPRRPGVPVDKAAAAPAYNMPTAAVPVDEATLWVRLTAAMTMSDGLVAAAKGQGVNAGYLNTLAQLDQRRRKATPPS